MKRYRVRFTMRRMIVAVAVSSILLLVGMRFAGRWSQLNRAAQARYEAALSLYRETEKRFLGGEVSLDSVYLQSRRIIEAQRELGDSTWASDHQRRLRSLIKRIPKNVCLDQQGQLWIDSIMKEADYWAARESW